MATTLQHQDITEKIIGAAFQVHSFLGNSFQEVIYQRCLSIELARAGLAHAREVEQTIYYDGIDVGTRRADFVVENQVIRVESLNKFRRCAFSTSQKLPGCL